MNPAIFREYDIRGIAGKDMTEAEVRLMGRGVGTWLQRAGCTSVVVGRDCRISSGAYAAAVTAGLCDTGQTVTDIGVCPTPVLYFAVGHLGRQAGVMVTASHNPAEYNGFKLCRGTDAIHGPQIQAIGRLIAQGDFVAGRGAQDAADVLDDYTRTVAAGIDLARPLRVGLDAGNGTAGVVAVPLIRRLGCEVHPLYCEMDGTFPNHPADPTVAANMRELAEMVQARGLDFGIGYDGDGDRLGVVDNTGQIVHGDRLMVLFAREILSRKPGATFIGEVKCSQVMYDEIERHGGRAIMWKTGHSLIKAKMKAEQAELAGEMSGHLFFRDRYLGFDDAIYASCRLLDLVAAGSRSLADLLGDVPSTVNTPEIRLDCPDEVKFDLVARVTAHFREHHEVIAIDGARILFDGGWGLVRASNTQPALVLRFEADSAERLEAIRQEVTGVLTKLRDAL